MSERTAADVEAEVGAWVDTNWDPDLTAGEWWTRLAEARYAHPTLPEHAGGLGWGRDLAQAALRAIAARNALGPPTGLGMMLAAPTIVRLRPRWSAGPGRARR
jgi:alkylation response protein AidB-like acyl-CoA dehydrogenase